MTIHSNSNWYSNFQCPACAAFYIPYSKDINCPKCGKNEGKECDFIDLAVASLQHNLSHDKSYVPGGWWTGCFSDHVLQLLFNLFESFRVANSEHKSFDEFAKTWIRSVNFEKQEYSRSHVLNIAINVNKKLNVATGAEAPDEEYEEADDAAMDKVYEAFDAANDVKFGTVYGKELLKAISSNELDKVKDIIAMPREKAGILMVRLTQCDINGDTAMHLAVKSGNLDMVKLLLSNGIRGFESKNKAGETPVTLATKLGYQNIYELLLRQ